MKTTRQDMALFANLHPYTSPDAAPLRYTIGGTTYRGIPTDWNPTVTRRRLDACMTETVIAAVTPEGLSVRAECTEFCDFPVVEWVMYISHDIDENCDNTRLDSPVISDWHIDLTLPCRTPRLYHGNGDSCEPGGYRFRTDEVTEAGITKRPRGDGCSCAGAFPYMRLLGADSGVNVAVGWSGTWQLDARYESIGDTDFVHLTVGQATFRSYLKPGETVRSPRLTLQAFDGGHDRGRNLWRSFYFAHLLPRSDGQPLEPKLVLHTWMIDGLPEFCGVTEKNQIEAIDTYIRGGLKPDIWWIDAGWYPCGNDWTVTGNWRHNPEHFPNGMTCVGEKCAAEGIDLLVWFEPERVRRGTELWQEHPEYLLFYHGPQNDWWEQNALLNLGNPEALSWVIETVDKLIKETGIKVYRQDFNIAPAVYWDTNTEPDREGILENLHTLGYYKYWDTLLERNPGLWIDSCASGGRRNDPETMRRAVPLHYTDIGYGDHHVKQLQHREMFEWIPYFRAHNYNWDEPNGDYNGQSHGIDDFGYHNALAPCVTSMIEYYDSDETFAVGRRFHPVWRKAAKLELSCDYYPLTECRENTADWYAMQFDGETEGFVQIIRNVRVTGDRITLTNLHIDESKTYTFTDELGKRSFTVSGSRLAAEGFSDVLPHRSGVVWFYTKE